MSSCSGSPPHLKVYAGLGNGFYIRSGQPSWGGVSALVLAIHFVFVSYGTASFKTDSGDKPYSKSHQQHRVPTTFEECLACYPVGSPVLATVLSTSSSAMVLSLVFARCLHLGPCVHVILVHTHTHRMKGKRSPKRSKQRSSRWRLCTDVDLRVRGLAGGGGKGLIQHHAHREQLMTDRDI